MISLGSWFFQHSLFRKWPVTPVGAQRTRERFIQAKIVTGTLPVAQPTQTVTTSPAGYPHHRRTNRLDRIDAGRRSGLYKRQTAYSESTTGTTGGFRT
jgi:hypothetical protein